MCVRCPWAFHRNIVSLSLCVGYFSSRRDFPRGLKYSMGFKPKKNQILGGKKVGTPVPPSVGDFIFCFCFFKQKEFTVN